MRHIYRTIPGWFSFADVYEDAVRSAPKEGAKFVEIGAWKGRSAAFMAVCIANSGKPIKFFVVDHWLGSDEHAHKIDADVQAGRLYDTFLRNVKPVSAFLTPMRMSSVDASAKFDYSTIDFVSLDGAHDYDSVKLDLISWLPKIKPGGTIAGDDWNWSGVKTAVGETFISSKIEILGQGKGRHWRVKL